jgi:hypothetical protein
MAVAAWQRHTVRGAFLFSSITRLQLDGLLMTDQTDTLA